MVVREKYGIYIGQTVNSFSKIWNTRRNIWKNIISKINCDLKKKYTLIFQYKKMHNEEISDNLSNSYKVQYLEKPETLIWIIQKNDGFKKLMQTLV